MKNLLSSLEIPVMLSTSPPLTVKSPFGIIALPSRSARLTSTLAPNVFCRSFSDTPSSFPPGATRCSTISRLPLEKASMRAALGNRRIREISLAHSYSGLTSREIPSASRKNSVFPRYSVSLTRATTCCVPSFRAEMPQTILTSSCSVAAISRSAFSAPASDKTSGFVALPSRQITSISFETWVMVSSSLSITVMSCPSFESTSARELPMRPAPASMIFIFCSSGICRFPLPNRVSATICRLRQPY